MLMSSPDSELQPYLQPDERLLWAGSPDQGVRLRSRDVFMIPFSLVWCGFAIFWTISATSAGAPFFFTLWGLMFVCFGLFCKRPASGLVRCIDGNQYGISMVTIDTSQW
jgi:hypothetical protein